jgi:hypothetical protein
MADEQMKVRKEVAVFTLNVQWKLVGTTKGLGQDGY